MNLAQLRALVDNLIDYDPVNETYREDVRTLLNNAQLRVLGDQAWDFLIEESRQRVLTDQTVSLTFINGEIAVTDATAPSPPGSFPISFDGKYPGSPWELATLHVTDSAGLSGIYTIRLVATSNTLSIDRPFLGASGTYSCSIRFRNVYLPADTVQLQGELRTDTGYPIKLQWLSQFSHDVYNLDADLLGAPENVLEGEAVYVPAPRSVHGVSAVTSGSGRGVRSVTVYMVNCMAPDYPGFDSYPGFSGGFESALSPGVTFDLADTELLTFTPETINPASGLYRRYYFTCTQAGVDIDAPRRVRNASGGTIGQDTVSPAGGVTLTPDLNLSTLQSQFLDAQLTRYQRTQGGSHRALQLSPHPSSDQDIIVRRLLAPRYMDEDQDYPSIPPASAQILAYEALRDLALKLDQPALAESFGRRADLLFRGMQQRYVSKPSRRIVRGASPAVYPTVFGPLTFT